MNPLLLAISVVVVFIAAIVVSYEFLLCSGRTYTSPKADRTEKNGHHLATAVIALVCFGLGTAVSLVPAMNHPILWITITIMGLFILPVRVIITELGIRRCRTDRPA
ncbi:MAG: hypothetical protein SGJ20_03060, partial [Planctomycetota bacterium]|nr:hypothetical protein [Planctomycetota bacterium]